MGFDRRIGDAPVAPTLFSPLPLARRLCGERLSQDLREHPEVVKDALEATTGVLESVRGRSTLTIIHAHGEQLMFERVARLPGHAWNWEDRTTPPSLADGLRLVPGAVIGGLGQWTTLKDGTPEAAAAEAEDAVAQTQGVGLIVGPGCVLPVGTPDANVAAVVEAPGGPLKRVPGATA